MRQKITAVLLGAALAAGCGGSGSSLVPPPQTGDAVVDAGVGGRIEVPPAPAGAGVATHTDSTLGFSIQFNSVDFALFTPPEYVTVLGNRLFELVGRTLPEGQIFRPNVGLITDPRFVGQPIPVQEYVANGIGILAEFFPSFQELARNVIAVDGREAVTLEHSASWVAPDGTVVPFHRITLFVRHRGEFLHFTFTAPPAVFETWRAAFQAMVSSIDLADEPATELRATLQGSQEVPAVATSATGSAVVTLSGDRSTITVVMETQGLVDPTAAHVHVGAVGVNGPIILTLYNAATDGPLPATLTRTLTAANLEPRPEQGISSFTDAVNAILAGNTYVNAHTQANPGGEIRGQLAQ